MIEKKTMNSSDSRWCSEGFDRSVDAITCWRISQESFIQCVKMINSKVLLDERRLSNYRMLLLREMKRSVSSFISICSSWSSLSWVTRGYPLNNQQLLTILLQIKLISLRMISHNLVSQNIFMNCRFSNKKVIEQVWKSTSEKRSKSRKSLKECSK